MAQTIDIRDVSYIHAQTCYQIASSPGPSPRRGRVHPGPGDEVVSQATPFAKGMACETRDEASDQDVQQTTHLGKFFSA